MFQPQPTGQVTSIQAPKLCRPSSAPSRGLAPINSANIGNNAPAGPHRPTERIQTAHPDALRRRKQAEARLAAAQMEALTARTPTWWVGPTPQNLISAATPESFRSALERQHLVVVDFFAPWCAACRRLFPKLLQLAENNPDVLFVKVNGGDEGLSKLVESMGVDCLPYFHLYREGKLQTHFAANLSKIGLLRAEIAAHKDCFAPNCLI